MKAIILAGGFGSRLQCEVKDLPKPMAPINGRPFLEFLISRLSACRVSEIILSVGYLHEKIVKHFGDGRGFNASIAYCVEHEPLGTGGGVRETLKLAGAGDSLIVNGDTYAMVDIENFVDFHRRHQVSASMVVIPVPNAERYGSVTVSDDGMVASFMEKGAAGPALINSGIYLANHSILDAIPLGHVSLELDVLPLLARQGRLAAQIQEVQFIDIGIPEDYREFCRNTARYVGAESFSAWSAGNE